MTLTIEIPSDVERILADNAARNGLTLTEYAAAVLSSAQPCALTESGNMDVAGRQDIAVRLAAFRAWQQEIANTPNPRADVGAAQMLDDGNESISRADFYGYTERDDSQL